MQISVSCCHVRKGWTNIGSLTWFGVQAQCWSKNVLRLPVLIKLQKVKINQIPLNTSQRQGSYPALNKKFKDFQGLHSVQKRPWVYVLFSSSQHEQFYPKGLSVFAGLERVSTWDSRTFKYLLQFSSTLKALNFSFKIQGRSSCEPCRGCYIQESCIRVFFCCCLQVDGTITRRA